MNATEIAAPLVGKGPTFVSHTPSPGSILATYSTPDPDIVRLWVCTLNAAPMRVALDLLAAPIRDALIHDPALLASTRLNQTELSATLLRSDAEQVVPRLIDQLAGHS